MKNGYILKDKLLILDNNYCQLREKHGKLSDSLDKNVKEGLARENDISRKLAFIEDQVRKTKDELKEEMSSSVNLVKASLTTSKGSKDSEEASKCDKLEKLVEYFKDKLAQMEKMGKKDQKSLESKVLKLEPLEQTVLKMKESIKVDHVLLEKKFTNEQLNAAKKLNNLESVVDALQASSMLASRDAKVSFEAELKKFQSEVNQSIARKEKDRDDKLETLALKWSKVDTLEQTITEIKESIKIDSSSKAEKLKKEQAKHEKELNNLLEKVDALQKSSLLASQEAKVSLDDHFKKLKSEVKHSYDFLEKNQNAKYVQVMDQIEKLKDLEQTVLIMKESNKFDLNDKIIKEQLKHEKEKLNDLAAAVNAFKATSLSASRDVKASFDAQIKNLKSEVNNSVERMDDKCEDLGTKMDKLESLEPRLTDLMAKVQTDHNYLNNKIAIEQSNQGKELKNLVLNVEEMKASPMSATLEPIEIEINKFKSEMNGEIRRLEKEQESCSEKYEKSARDCQAKVFQLDLSLKNDEKFKDLNTRLGKLEPLEEKMRKFEPLDKTINSISEQVKVHHMEQRDLHDILTKHQKECDEIQNNIIVSIESSKSLKDNLDDNIKKLRLELSGDMRRFETEKGSALNSLEKLTKDCQARIFQTEKTLRTIHLSVTNSDIDKKVANLMDVYKESKKVQDDFSKFVEEHKKLQAKSNLEQVTEAVFERRISKLKMEIDTSIRKVENNNRSFTDGMEKLSNDNQIKTTLMEEAVKKIEVSNKEKVMKGDFEKALKRVESSIKESVLKADLKSLSDKNIAEFERIERLVAMVQDGMKSNLAKLDKDHLTQVKKTSNMCKCVDELKETLEKLSKSQSSKETVNSEVLKLKEDLETTIKSSKIQHDASNDKLEKMVKCCQDKIVTLFQSVKEAEASVEDSNRGTCSKFEAVNDDLKTVVEKVKDLKVWTADLMSKEEKDCNTLRMDLRNIQAELAKKTEDQTSVNKPGK